MEEIKQINDVLDRLGLAYEHSCVEPDLERYEITVDQSEDLTVTGLLYRTDDGVFFRLLAYVDELDQEQTVNQLKILLALNGDIPTGAFCLDPEEGVIYVTVNVPLPELNKDLLEWALEFLFAAQDVYYSEFYPEPPEDMAQG